MRGSEVEHFGNGGDLWRECEWGWRVFGVRECRFWRLSGTKEAAVYDGRDGDCEASSGCCPGTDEVEGCGAVYELVADCGAK